MNQHGIRNRSISLGYVTPKHRILVDNFYITFTVAMLAIGGFLAAVIKMILEAVI